MKNFRDVSKLFIVGVKDFNYSPELKSFLKDYRPSGIALFNSPFDNPSNIWQDRESSLEIVHEFMHKIKDSVNFVACDQEGGRVRRLRGAFTHLPAGQKVAEALQDKASMAQILELYRYAAKQMAATGIHLNFAPVCDLRLKESSNVVGDRSFGSTEAEALPLIEAFCKAFEEENVHTTLKHFPGHGPTTFDSHERPATIFKSKEEVFREDREIFVKAAAKTSAIMTAHLTYEDFQDRVISIDPEFLTELKAGLPKNLAWITDDLQGMKAVSERKPWLAAFDCQYDFELICGSLDQSAVAIEETIRHAESKVKNFSDETKLTNRLSRAENFFDDGIEIANFDQWKKSILEWESKANEVLQESGLA